MQYREMGKTGDRVSILGYGCMRFPHVGGRFDMPRAARQVVSAVERGVNYLDTAYIYPGNEAAVGQIVESEGLRDKIMLATKLPPMYVNSRRDMEKILDAQLKRLRTDHIDYYLMHMLMTFGGWERLKQLGIEDFLQKARESGKISRVAFSYHGDRDNFIKIVDDYAWDMCQLQYNYVDEHNQATRVGLEYAGHKGVGVVVMEPLRGGRLANRLPDTVMQTLNGAGEASPTEWALRWVWDNEYVTSLLSGMNEEAHIDENIRVACSAAPNALTDDEKRMFDDIRRDIKAREPVPCTSCGYCQPCPRGVAIPLCFAMLNDTHLYGDKRQRLWYISRLTGVDGSARSYASLCNKCGVCEKKCPQGLTVRKYLDDVKKELEPWYFKPAAGLIRAYMGLRRLGKKKNPPA